MLPLTRDQFLGVFAEHNYHAAVWPAQFVAYGLRLAMVLLVFHPGAAMRRTLNTARAHVAVDRHRVPWLHFVRFRRGPAMPRSLRRPVGIAATTSG